MTTVYYRIRKETAAQDLNAIGWKARVSNAEVAKNLFHKSCESNMYLACMIDGKSNGFFYPGHILYSKALEPPLLTELGEIK